MVFWHATASFALSHLASKHSLPGCGYAVHSWLGSVADVLQQYVTAAGGGGGGWPACSTAAAASSAAAIYYYVLRG